MKPLILATLILSSFIATAQLDYMPSNIPRVKDTVRIITMTADQYVKYQQLKGDDIDNAYKAMQIARDESKKATECQMKLERLDHLLKYTLDKHMKLWDKYEAATDILQQITPDGLILDEKKFRAASKRYQSMN